MFVRWDQQSIDREVGTRLPGYSDVTVRHFDAPEAIDTRFYEVQSKSILNRVPEASQMPFRWTVNPYRGCAHACTYCFARPTHEYLELGAGRDFEREIVVKVNAPERLRAELGRSGWQHEHVALGTNTDPYQWVEGRYELMRGIWQALRDARNPCSVLTKSPLLLRDLDLMKQISAVTDFSAALSIPTLDRKAWRETEPRSPSPTARLEAVAELTRAGIRTSVLIAPLMPGINDSPEQVREVVRLATEAGAVHITGIALHLRRGRASGVHGMAGGEPPGTGLALRGAVPRGRVHAGDRASTTDADARRATDAAEGAVQPGHQGDRPVCGESLAGTARAVPAQPVLTRMRSVGGTIRRTT